MALEFDVKSIRSFGGMLGGVGAVGLHSPSSYLQEHGLEALEMGMFHAFDATHQVIHDNAMKTFNRISDVLWNSKRELEDAADQYEETERDNRDQVWGAGARLWTREEAEQADGSIGAVRRPPADRTTPGPRDFDLEPDPYRHLDRADNLVRQDPAKPVRELLDWISPAAWVGWTVEQLTGYEPFKEVSEFFAGDWEAFGRIADVWRRLGASMYELSNRIWKGNRTLDEVWHGNAADMCFGYHHRLAFSIKALHTPLETLADTYKLLAVNVTLSADAVKDLLQQLTDNVIFAGLHRLGVSAALPASVLLTIKRIWKLVERVKRAMDVLRALIAGAAGTAARAGQLIAAFQTSFPPVDNYHNWVRGR